MNSIAPISGIPNGVSPSPIEPARLQFIRQNFPELPGSSGEGRDWLRWVHDRLFLDGWQIPAVRAELSCTLISTRTIAVTSGKGGVGKTTFTVNLAAAFAQQGRRVLLFDADLGMANVHVLAGVTPQRTILDVIDGRASLESILVPGPAGMRIACGASGVGRIADLDRRTLDALGREVMRVASAFDVLLLDTGAGISPSVMHFLALAQDAIVIATPDLTSTLDAYGVMKVAHEQRLETRLHLLVNEAADETQAGETLARIAGCSMRFLQKTPGDLGFLKRDSAFEISNQQRRPLVLAQPENASARRIVEIAARFLAAPASSVAA